MFNMTTPLLIASLVALTFLGCGCYDVSDIMPQQIKETKEKCTEAGLGVGYNKFPDGEICRVFCVEPVTK